MDSTAGGGSTHRASVIRLYDWAPSPFCMKVRAILAHKGLEYERVSALKRWGEVRRRGGIGKVPALEIDGTLYADSTDIVHELESRYPSPPVLPADPRDRALRHALEEYSDEALYFYGLYYHWHDPLGRAAVKKFFAKTTVGRLAYRPFLIRIERQLWGHGITRKSPPHVWRDLQRNIDAIEGMLTDRDYLLGDAPYLCDFGIASQLKYLTLAKASRELLADRPNCTAYLSRMSSVRL